MASPRLLLTIETLIREGRLREAKSLIGPQLIQHPREPGVLAGGAMVMMATLQFNDALNLLERALEHDPDSAWLHLQRGICLLQLRESEAAEVSLRQALVIEPHNSHARASLVSALDRSGRLCEAVELGESYLQESSDEDVAHALLSARSQLDPEAAFQRGLELHNQHQFRADILSTLSMFSCYSDAASQADILEFGRSYSQTLIEQGIVGKRVQSRLDPHTKPVIGLVSSDFRQHAVANFLMPLVLALKTLGYKVHGYMYAGVADEITDRFRKQIHVRLFPSKQEHELIDQILKDRVEMLFDLNGYTAGGFQALYVQDLCPSVVHYLGFPNTTGMPGLRHRLVDEVTDAQEDPLGYSERLVKMEPPFLCYAPLHPLPAVQERESRTEIRLASFNNFQKLSRATAELWAEALHATPESRLILKSMQSSNPDVCAAVLRRFEGLELDDRIEFWPKSTSEREHLECYNAVDIALDPTPYNGTTTTCDALAMGVPVVTLAGVHHRSRVGASLLGSDPALGVVAESPVAFAQAVASLAAKLPRKEAVREAFVSSPVCDLEGFSARLGRALEQVWIEACGQ